VIAPAVLANGAHTGHQFSVTETGAATVSIPIQVPRGIGGMEPQLSLNYSSGAGNGLLGIGWTLAGPSAITRCPKTIQHDGVRGAVKFQSGDRFCLDGQRLVSTVPTSDSAYMASGTQYFTERESFSLVTANGSLSGAPASFEVKTKAGLILEFGLSDNSRALTKFTDGSADVTSRWMLQRISDRMAIPTFVEFVYCGGQVSVDGLTCTESPAAYTGSKVLHYIRYSNRGSANGSNAVVFGYEARPDRQQSFHAGSSQVQTQRLASIATYVGFSAPAAPGSRVKSYELTYDPMTNTAGAWVRATNYSRLTRIQELRGAVSLTTRPPPVRLPGESLPPIDFTYAEDTVLGKALVQSGGTGPVSRPPILSCGGYVGAYRRAEICP
jgi:Salmonella virulence plasmid 65kDa B protein